VISLGDGPVDRLKWQALMFMVFFMPEEHLTQGTAPDRPFSLRSWLLLAVFGYLRPKFFSMFLISGYVYVKAS